MVKRAFLIHGWRGYPEEGWRPWLKKELMKRGFEVQVPSMPDADNPKMGAWLAYLSEVIGAPDKDCYFVGHSLGCITTLRYLETLRENQKAGGAVLVGGFTDEVPEDEIEKELETFFEKPINWKKIKLHCKRFVAIHSDDDPVVSLKHADVFKEKLNAEIIIEHNMKHFSSDDGITKLPSALKAVLEISE